ncbi:MAG: response regulator [Thermoplasmata archaeon]
MKILVVDDDKDIQKMFKDILEKCGGYQVTQADDGKGALIEYQESKPDIVLMDILMPHVDGIESTKKILKQDKNAKIVVVTAAGKPGLEEMCIEAGAKMFIKKPFKINYLLDVIQKVSRGVV